ncbi:GL20844 [Drosophila persimilis]|uniref:GL20844 n=1 Tax=Drosophila persimilis TaxID=7234 RepID=B4H4B4_DROPE|nr:GL20844 [Drosophila persimilis]
MAAALPTALKCQRAAANLDEDQRSQRISLSSSSYSYSYSSRSRCHWQECPPLNGN